MAGFKSGKNNVQHKMKLRIAELEEQLSYERNIKPMLESVAADLANNMLIVLATIPYEHWPALAKTCLDNVATTRPTAVLAYKGQLAIALASGDKESDNG